MIRVRRKQSDGRRPSTSWTSRTSFVGLAFASALLSGSGARAAERLPALIAPSPAQAARRDTRIAMSAIPLEKAREALAKGDSAQALALCRPLANGPLATRAALVEAEAWMASGEFQKARRAYERALKTSDLRVTSVSAAKGLVGALERLGEHAQALKYLEALIDARGVSEKAVLEYRRAETLAALGRPKDAAEAAFRILVRRPEAEVAPRASTLLDELVARGVRRPVLSPELDLARTARLAKLGNPRDALLAIQKAAERHPTRALTLAQLEVDVLRRVDRDVQAEQILRRLRREGRSPRPDEILFQLGRIALSRDDNALAEAWFGELLASHPESKDAEEAAFFSAWLPFREANFAEGAARMRAFASLRQDADRRPEALWFAAFNAFLQRDFENAAIAMKQLEDEYRTSPLLPKARYWYARVEESKGGAAEARRALRREMQRAPLTYYGLLARARLQKEGEDAAFASAQVPVVSADATRIIAALGKQRPILIDRALAYHEAGLDDYAREDAAAAQTFLRRVDKGKRDVVLDLLNTIGAHREEFRYALRFFPGAASRAMARGARATRHAFPVAHKEVVHRASADFGVAPELVLAIMRTESQFDPNARSHVGASGLMQLLPVTAERIGSAEPSLQVAASRFRRADANIRLGAWYIRSLLDRYDGQVPLAIAAYNAGPVAVDGWLEDLAGLDLDVFVERIPYRETRGYVQRVLEAYFAYGLFDQHFDLSLLLAPIRRVHLPADAVGF